MLRYEPYPGQDCGLGALAGQMVTKKGSSIYNLDNQPFIKGASRGDVTNSYNYQQGYLEPKECKCLPGAHWDSFYRQCVCRGEEQGYDFGQMMRDHIDDLSRPKDKRIMHKTHDYCKKIFEPTFKQKKSMQDYSETFFLNLQKDGQIVFPVVTTQFGNVSEVEKSKSNSLPVKIKCEKGSEHYRYAEDGKIKVNKQFCVKCPKVDKNGECLKRNDENLLSCGLGAYVKDIYYPGKDVLTKKLSTWPISRDQEQQTNTLDRDQCKCLPGASWNEKYKQCICENYNSSSYAFDNLVDKFLIYSVYSAFHVSFCQNPSYQLYNIFNDSFRETSKNLNFTNINDMKNKSIQINQQNNTAPVMGIRDTQFGDFVQGSQVWDEKLQRYIVECNKGSQHAHYQTRASWFTNKSYCVRCPFVDKDGNCVKDAFLQ